MNLHRVDHTALVVRDMDDALSRYASLFPGDRPEIVLVPDQRVKVAFLSLGDTQLELIQPTDITSGVARFLEARGEGLHHVGIAVPDIVAELQRLSDAGFSLIDRAPRRGVHGPIAFVHPRSTGGVLVELVQHTD